MKICQYRYHSSIGPIRRMGILINNNEIIDPNFTIATEWERMGYYSPFTKVNNYLPSSLHALLTNDLNPMDKLEEAYGVYLFLKKIGLVQSKEGYPISVKLNNRDIPSYPYSWRYYYLMYNFGGNQ